MCGLLTSSPSLICLILSDVPGPLANVAFEEKREMGTTVGCRSHSVLTSCCPLCRIAEGDTAVGRSSARVLQMAVKLLAFGIGFCKLLLITRILI